MSLLSSTIQLPSRAGRTITSGRTGWICTEPNFRPGLGLSRLISAIISTSSSASTPTARLQRGEIVAAEQSQVVEQLGDLRIVAVLILELQRQAFGQVAREHAGRIEALQRGQDLLDQRLRRAELVGEVVEVALQIAGLVDHVDEMRADQPLGRDR